MNHIEGFKELCTRCILSMIENEKVNHEPFLKAADKLEKLFTRFSTYIEVCPNYEDKNKLSELYAVKVKSLYEQAVNNFK